MQRLALKALTEAIKACLLLCLWSFAPSYAQNSADETDRWIRAEGDDPQALKDELQTQWKALPATDEARRIRVLSRLTHVCYLLDDLETLETLLPQIEAAKPRALELKLINETALMNIGLSLHAYTLKNGKKAIDHAQEALTLAKQSQNPNTLLQVLVFQSDLFYRLDFDQQSVQVIIAARADVKNNPNVHPTLRLAIDIDVVQQNFEADRTVKNLQLLEHYYVQVQDMKLRFQAGVLSFFLADAYLNLETPDIKKSIYYFKDSLQKAQSIRDDYTAAAAAYKIAAIANQQADYQTALEFGQKALAFARNKGTIWRFKALRELAQTQLQRGAIDEAKAAIQQSLDAIAPEQSAERIRSLQVAKQIYKKTREVDQALGTAEEMILLMQRLKKSKSSEDFSKSKVLLGLEASQLQNQILEKDRQLMMKDSQLKIVELEKVKKDSTIKTVIVAFFLVTVPILILFLVYAYRQRKKIHDLNVHLQTDVLGRFLPPALVQDVVDKKIVWDEHAHHMEVTIVFADLVDFTRICESMDPQRISSIMNRFFSAMSRVIYSERGTLDKFIGDAVMILFGAPVGMGPKEQIERSISCARKMLDALDELNKELQSEDGTRFAMRIGIHSGPVIAGMFGSQERSDYTAVGMTVNIASRIEGLAKPDQILASQAVIGGLPRTDWYSAGLFKLKGISEPQELFEVRRVAAADTPSHTEKSAS